MLVVAAILLVSIVLSTSPIASTHDASAQANGNMTGGMMGGGSSNQSQTSFGPNITGTVALGPTIAKAIASQVHVSYPPRKVLASTQMSIAGMMNGGMGMMGPGIGMMGPDMGMMNQGMMSKPYP